MNLAELRRHLKVIATTEVAQTSQRFFKTGRGQYGEGDLFIGIKVPVLRKVAREVAALPLIDLEKLLESKIHEERLLALYVLIFQYKKSRSSILIEFYLKHLDRVNNWDLVDSSAPYLLGEHLLRSDSHDVNILNTLVKSKNLWERRVAILSTLAFIRAGQLDQTLELAKILLTDTEDLMHKAVGWMLREVGKKDQKILVNFLNENTEQMPRTALRYAIERFPEAERKQFLSRKKA